MAEEKPPWETTADDVAPWQTAAPTAPTTPEEPFDFEKEVAKRRASLATGFGDPVVGAAQLATRMPSLGLPPPIAGVKPLVDLGSQLLTGGSIDQYAKRRETELEEIRGKDAGFDWDRLIGNFLNPANWFGGAAVKPVEVGGKVLSNVGRAVAKPASQGAVAGTLQPVEDADKFATTKTIQTGAGAAIGGALGATFAGLGAGWQKVGEWIARNYPENIEFDAVKAVMRRMKTDAKYGSPTATEALELVAAAREAGQPMVLADVAGPETRALAGSITRKPGEARALSNQVLKERDLTAKDRMDEVIAEYVHSGPTAHQTTKMLMSSRTAASKAPYEEWYNTEGIWSPRLQEFFSDPDIRAGMNKAWHMIRRETVGTDQAPRMTQFGADLDIEGNLILPDKPNNRLLDMAKRGLDAIISDSRDPLTGALSAEGRSYAIMRQNFLNEIDSIDTKGIYKKAREAWAGPSGSLDAVKLGRAIFNASPEVIKDAFSLLSRSDQDFFRLGVADIMRERIMKVGLTGDEAKRLINNPWMQEQLRPMFKSSNDFDAFVKAITNEKTMFETKHDFTGNSKTAARLAEDESPLMSGVVVARSIATGHWHRAVVDAWKFYRDLGIKDNPELNQKIAEILFTDPVPGSRGWNLLTGKIQPTRVNPAEKAAAATMDLGSLATPPAVLGTNELFR